MTTFQIQPALTGTNGIAAQAGPVSAVRTAGMVLNKVLLCGCVLGQSFIRDFAIRHGRGLSFFLRTGFPENTPAKQRDDCETVSVVVYDTPGCRLASRAAGLIRAGRRILVEGSLRHRVRYQVSGPEDVTEVEASNIELLDDSCRDDRAASVCGR